MATYFLWLPPKTVILCGKPLKRLFLNYDTIYFSKNCPIIIHLCFLLAVNHMEQSYFFGRFALLWKTKEILYNTIPGIVVNSTTYSIVAVLTQGQIQNLMITRYFHKTRTLFPGTQNLRTFWI